MSCRVAQILAVSFVRPLLLTKTQQASTQLARACSVAAAETVSSVSSCVPSITSSGVPIFQDHPVFNPRRTAVPLWGHTSQILSGLSPQRDSVVQKALRPQHSRDKTRYIGFGHERKKNNYLLYLELVRSVVKSKTIPGIIRNVNQRFRTDPCHGGLLLGGLRFPRQQAFLLFRLPQSAQKRAHTRARTGG